MSNRRRLIPPPRILQRGIQLGGGAQLVRNVATGRALPCHLPDCDKNGDDRYHITVPHEDPLFPGHMLRRIFCSIDHRDLYGGQMPRIGAILQ